MAPVPEVRIKVLRSFYVRKDDLRVAGTFTHVPATMVPMLISDGKAVYAPEKAEKKQADKPAGGQADKQQADKRASGQAGKEK